MSSGVNFGADISSSDRQVIQLAYDLWGAFWGGRAITVFAYSSIDAVIAAYESACRCAASSIARQSLSSEFVSTEPNVLMVWVGNAFHGQSREILIGSTLMHSMTHSLQRGYSPNDLTPVWMVEGNAEYSDVHGGARDENAMHQYGRDESRNQNFTLAQLETYGSASGFDQPFGRAPYNLGHFATDLLATRRGRSSIPQYWKTFGENRQRMSSDSAWRAAFESTFGLSVTDFYAQFEDYRRRGSP